MSRRRGRRAARSRRRLPAAVGVALLASVALGAPAPSAPPAPEPAADTLVLSSKLRVRVRAGRSLELEVLAGEREGYEEIAAGVTGSRSLGPTLEQINGRRRPAGSFVRVPLTHLADEYRALVLLNLFPQDRRDQADWIHLCGAGVVPTYDEGLWQVAEWFTGDGSRFTEIQKANGLAGPEVSRGQPIRIPGALLHPALRPRPLSDDGLLEYGEDARGPFAGYRLRRGEALYSSVVVRFTGRTSADDVNGLAEELARRSDILDLRDIPVGFLVKVPFDLLEPEFLPASHPRRLEAEAARAEVEASLRREPVGRTRGGLEGVVIILDPGHGGRDLGTMNHGIWEHDYVYDVACRLKARLERDTASRVFLTLEDEHTGCVPSAGDRLEANLQGTVKTTPPFLATEVGDAAVGVNLRWYVANSIFRKSVRDGTDPNRVVFLSLHADARHPALRGVMAYVPGAQHRERPYGHGSAEYRRFREVREQPRVHFSRAERVRSEAVSRKLAAAIVDAFARENLPVQSLKPVRDTILRGRQRWLPAVLRGNAVPASVLVEILNMSNRDDAALLASAASRERVAAALERSIFDYFGEKPPAPRVSASR